MIELHVHVHIHQEADDMKKAERYRGPQMDGMPVILAAPGLGQGISRPDSVRGQWGQELPPLVMATPPWLESAREPDGGKGARVIPLPRQDWKSVPRQFARSA